MRNKIFTGWTFRRFLYLGIGVMIVIQSIRDQQWVLALAGIYFAAMGLFAFGCASFKVNVVVVMVVGVIASLNVIPMALLVATPVAPLIGSVETTVGGVTSTTVPVVKLKV